MTRFVHSYSIRPLYGLICLLLILPALATQPTQAATSATITPNGVGAMGEPAIIVSGAGAIATLKDVQDHTPAGLLTENVVNGQHIWTLKRSLLVQKGATLDVSGGTTGAAEGAQVDWLRLRSDTGSPIGSTDFYTHFVSLRTKDATLLINSTTITSWNTSANTYDTTVTDGRAYIVAKGVSRMNITSSNLSYLGSSDGESYGVAWRDTDSNTSGVPNTRVTGDVKDSIFSHNYYGLYTFQAGNMSFLRNKMFSNIEYGFDPHDYTHDVDVEDNESYDNGSHGYIISRGCTNFTFLRNSSHDNKVRTGSKNPSAHGFMLDPGADPAKALVPQAPSTHNIYRDNTAYNNDGYGFRILQSNNNTIQHNTFTNNRAGISLEGGSTGNLIDNNSISGSIGLTSGTTLSQGYGIQIVTAADANSITNNSISNNKVVGINVKTGKNLIQGNTITGNTNNGISIVQDTGGPDENEPPADGTTTPKTTTTAPNANQLKNNTIASNTGKGIVINAASSTLVQGNTLSQNGGPGISITGVETSTLVQSNTISGNNGYGIEVYGSASAQTNTFTQNSITNNTANAISVRNGSNAGITAPIVVQAGPSSFSGTSRPNALIEVFSDPVDEAAYYEGSTTANSSGVFSFTPASTPKNAYLTFLATDAAGNSSALSARFAAPQISDTPTAMATATATATATPSATVTPSPTTPATVTPSPITTATPSPTADSTYQPVDQQFQVYLPIIIR